jgi:hypothetical protein
MAYGYTQAEILVRRELELQFKLTQRGMVQPLMNPLLLGPVGGGKSSIGRNAALHFIESGIIDDLFFAPINTGETSDATEVTGVPVPGMIKYFQTNGTAGERQGAQHAYMEWVLNRYAAMACAQPVFLFFDDIDKAPPTVQGALLGVTGNRSFRDKKLHPMTLIMGAGNRSDDDQLAGELSESLRTRMTTIEMIPDIVSFSKYGLASGEIHPTVIGFLQAKPEYLHKVLEGHYRFPTPRSWWEASQQFFAWPDPTEDVFKTGGGSNWEGIVARKCGTSIANDFWAWYEIVSKIDVQKLLRTGNLPVIKDDAERRMQQYAAIFAVAQELNNKGVKKEYVGIEALTATGLDPEMRVALVIQLSMKARTAISSMFPAAANYMLGDLIMLPTGKAAIVGNTTP